MITLYSEDKDCCGCGGCASVCPKNAISMKKNQDGFLFPEINQEKCIECGLCKKSCGYQEEYNLCMPIESYAAVNKDQVLLEKSTSGGIFSAIAEKFINSENYVCGATIDFENSKATVKHVIINSKEKLYRLQKSKYVQSSTSEVYKEVRQLLKNGETVLFSGTPCQVAEMKKVAGKNIENLYTIDIICHGVPSEEFFNEYLKREAKKKKIKINSFTFRNKKYGWGLDGNISGITEQGKKIEMIINPENSSYYHYFLEGEIYRESCYVCPYANNRRVGDLTIGDYWGIEKNNPELLSENGGPFDEKKGISCLMVNTKQGKNLIEKFGTKIEKYPVSYTNISMVNTQLNHPASHTELRSIIFEIYRGNGYDEIESIFEKYRSRQEKIKKIKRRVKKILPDKVVCVIKNKRKK